MGKISWGNFSTLLWEGFEGGVWGGGVFAGSNLPKFAPPPRAGPPLRGSANLCRFVPVRSSQTCDVQVRANSTGLELSDLWGVNVVTATF